MSNKLTTTAITEAEIAASTLIDEMDARFTSPTDVAEAELLLAAVFAERDRLAGIVEDLAADDNPMLTRDHRPDGTVYMKCRYGCGIGWRNDVIPEVGDHEISCLYRRAVEWLAEKDNQ